MVTAKDIMTKNVITIDENMKVYELIELLAEKSISGVPVINKQKELVGIVTKSDIMGFFLDFEIDLNIKIGLKDILEFKHEKSEAEITPERDMEIRKIMSINPVTATEDTPIEELAKIMVDRRIHRIIIMKDKSITGIVSPLDLLRFIAGRKQ